MAAISRSSLKRTAAITKPMLVLGACCALLCLVLNAEALGYNTYDSDANSGKCRLEERMLKVI